VARAAKCKKVPYDKLHEYTTEGLIDWYKRFPPNAAAAAQRLTRRARTTMVMVKVKVVLSRWMTALLPTVSFTV
jgi:hypothetical protein